MAPRRTEFADGEQCFSGVSGARGVRLSVRHLPDDALLAVVPSSEAELQELVIERAQRLGYLVHHDRPARTANGWRTAVQGFPGFPDIVLVMDDSPEVGWNPRVMFVELKSARGRLSEEQECWLDVLANAGAETHLWKPSDWVSGAIERVLRGEEERECRS